jgi:8-oxo-dGTP diphosphatase
LSERSVDPVSAGLQGTLQLFSVNEFDDRIEYTYWEKANLDIEKINLHEGQQLKWFTEVEVRNTKLAYGFNEIVDDFFQKITI